ncbi:GTPase IMAP family member 7-like [Etheostoma cragini]|uniref:GTPase IMAP family member 7-like n=1 Tax=Etheostoma cragini TaxID=417921 RepID=UPI00155E438E|nr:GTPase IMAP family member 7-like [Etheostoma cragini]
MNTSTKDLYAVLVGSKSSRKCLVGNIILGRQAFDPRDVTSHCERGEREIFGQTITLVTSPGWLRGYTLYHTAELFKTEAILSVTLCPPGLHSFILVINAELPFKKEYKKATREHLQHFFGDKVWDHTIVAFSQRSQIGHKTIEDYITREGAPLQSLLEECGNRYLTLYDDGADNDVKVKELFEKIDALVAKNGRYEADSTLLQSTELKRKEVAKKAEELRRSN